MMLASIVLPRPTSSARMARPPMSRSTRWATSIWCGSSLIALASSVINRSNPGTRAMRSASRRSSYQARSAGGSLRASTNSLRERSSTAQESSGRGRGRGRGAGVVTCCLWRRGRNMEAEPPPPPPRVRSREGSAWAGDRDLLLEADVGGRGAELHHDGSVLDDPAVGVRIPVGEGGTGERELDRLGLAGVKRHPPEAPQVPPGARHRRARVSHVKLHDLVTGAGARVLHVDRDGDRGVAAQRVAARSEAIVREGGVAQAVPERVEGHAVEETVGAPGHAVIVEGREVGHTTIEGHRQPAAGI